MSQLFNINGGIELSQSIIGSFKNYFMKFTSKELYLTDTDSWGWFVDIDLYNNPFRNSNGLLDKKYSKIFSKNVEILPTINELPSIRSMKSMKNLADMAFDDIFVKNLYTNDNKNNNKNNKDTNDKDNDKDTNTNNENTIFNIICVIGVISLYYLLIVL